MRMRKRLFALIVVNAIEIAAVGAPPTPQNFSEQIVQHRLEQLPEAQTEPAGHAASEVQPVRHNPARQVAPAAHAPDGSHRFTE